MSVSLKGGAALSLKAENKFAENGSEQLLVLGHQAGYGLGELLYRKFAPWLLPQREIEERLFEQPLATELRQEQQQQQEKIQSLLHPLFNKKVIQEDDLKVFFDQLYSLATSLGIGVRTAPTLHQRVHIVALFYFFLFFLPALIWGDTRSLFHFPKPFYLNLWRDLGLAGGAAIAVILVSYLLSKWVVPFRRLSTELRGFLGELTVEEGLMIAAFSAAGEELLFRGVLQAEVGWITAAIFFAALHFVPNRRFIAWPLFALVVGLLLGWLYTISGNLWVPILAHFLINFVNILLMTRENKIARGA